MLQEKVIEIKKNLSVDIKNTSAYRRSLTCASDQRPSAAHVGYLGIGILSLTCGLLLCADLLNLCKTDKWFAIWLLILMKILQCLMNFFSVVSLQFLTYYSISQILKSKFNYDPNFFLCHISLSGRIAASRGMIRTLKYGPFSLRHVLPVLRQQILFKFYVEKLLSQSFPSLVSSISICKTTRREIINFITLQRAFCFEYIFLIGIRKTKAMNNDS